jgi:hypothetical protein
MFHAGPTEPPRPGDNWYRHRSGSLSPTRRCAFGRKRPRWSSPCPGQLATAGLARAVRKTKWIRSGRPRIAGIERLTAQLAPALAAVLSNYSACIIGVDDGGLPRVIDDVGASSIECNPRVRTMGAATEPAYPPSPCMESAWSWSTRTERAWGASALLPSELPSTSTNRAAASGRSPHWREWCVPGHLLKRG